MNEDWMIEVENLTKQYPGHAAVKGVSFKVKRGEIVGLLGPNGAGKSTIIRILAGFIPATSGTVRAAGFDVFHQCDAVRRRIGYMPENNPLHLDMRVRHYLKFRARLKGLSRSASRERVTFVMDQCGLADVALKMIGHLSKGYRQRVGLADALVHEPELIILDEPTIGLDPNQLRSVRRLIKDLGGRHTVLLSTHILPEVEMTCNRVVILHEGRILAADTTEALHQRMRAKTQVVTEIAAPAAALEGVWRDHPDVETLDVSPSDGDYCRCALTTRPGIDLRPMIFDHAVSQGWRIRELRESRHSLEDIFVEVIQSDKEEEEFF